MVWLGGPRGWRPGSHKRPRGIYLHDPPPGYHPPRPGIPLKDRQRQARQDWALMRVATVVLVLAAVAFIVIMFLIIATHG
jgi:hypothetical protein